VSADRRSLLYPTAGGLRPAAGSSGSIRVEAHGHDFRIVLKTQTRAADAAAKRSFARVAELEGVMRDYKKTAKLMRLGTVVRHGKWGSGAVKAELFTYGVGGGVSTASDGDST